MRSAKAAASCWLRSEPAPGRCAYRTLIRVKKQIPTPTDLEERILLSDTLSGAYFWSICYTPRWTLLAKFDGEFAPGSQTYAGSGALRYSW
jgi:hypothetical protein